MDVMRKWWFEWEQCRYCFRRGDIETAVKHGETALTLAMDPIYRAVTLMTLARIEVDSDNFEQASNHLQEAARCLSNASCNTDYGIKPLSMELSEQNIEHIESLVLQRFDSGYMIDNSSENPRLLHCPGGRLPDMPYAPFLQFLALYYLKLGNEPQARYYAKEAESIISGTIGPNGGLWQ